MQKISHFGDSKERDEHGLGPHLHRDHVHRVSKRQNRAGHLRGRLLRSLQEKRLRGHGMGRENCLDIASAVGYKFRM